MKEFWSFIQIVLTAVGGWLGWFLGGCDGLIVALVIFAVLDYITVLMCAVADKKLSSAVGFKGICWKVLIFALVGVGHILDTQVIGTGSVLRTAITFTTCPMKVCLLSRMRRTWVCPYRKSFTTGLRRANNYQPQISRRRGVQDSAAVRNHPDSFPDFYKQFGYKGHNGIDFYGVKNDYIFTFCGGYVKKDR